MFFCFTASFSSELTRTHYLENLKGFELECLFFLMTQLSSLVLSVFIEFKGNSSCFFLRYLVLEYKAFLNFSDKNELS